MATRSKTTPPAKKGTKPSSTLAPKKKEAAKTAKAVKAVNAHHVKAAASKTASKVKAKTTKSVPTKVAPAKSAHPKAASAKATPVKATQVKAAPVKAQAKAKEIKKTTPAKPIHKPTAAIKTPEPPKTPVALHSKPTPSDLIKTQNKKSLSKEIPETGNAPKPNGKSRYSDKELAEFKALIDEKLGNARQELNYLQEQIVEMNENNADIQGSDWFDDSSIHSEVELLNNMAIRQRQFIQNLENALVRIENKTYGICTVTGNLIDKKRLLLVPHATKSIEAKHIEQASMVPDINQVAPDERVIRRSLEGKQLKKSGVKRPKGKSSKDFEDEDAEEIAESPIEDVDMNFEGGD